jgi:hypothetical protein
MSNELRPHEAYAEEVSARLNEGLKTCRTMIDNYRAMLRGEPRPRLKQPDAVEQDNYPNSRESA